MKRVAALSGVVFLLSVAPATARVVGSERASGDYAVAVASGSASDPSVLKVNVRASGGQKVDVDWTVVCSRGFGAGSKSGRFSAYAPATRRVKMPMRNPDDCTFSAAAQLSRSGTLKVRLLAF